LEFVNQILHHRAVVILISDFLGETNPSRRDILAHLKRKVLHSETLGRLSAQVLRQTSRRHDVVAVQIADPREREIPSLGRLLLQDAETGEVVEVNSHDRRRREAFQTRASRSQAELDRLFRGARVDAIHVQTGKPYEVELTRFFHERELRRRH
jgi:hypothetical protein